METTRNFPYLRKIPGLERMDVSTRDFESRNRPLLLTWALIFFGLAAASLVARLTIFTEGPSALLFTLFLVLFGILGLISWLARIVNTPVG
ncbi:hypothetical protein FIV42_17435 [Persicimonas caeni]|uniref:Uncharacterized protein n=1 Tax=Persicimonas caeni TaxID=2292766 RepID=A0A4Y6PVV0_PERCE|nr:hypothetical protein [Persicimonas caeni]QDG52456.1 hypothetical protein FIV42_17435 [Persicimonas caeni]QED33678.1 hypothetical protein FRD00_17430 [Persicimonas caeni]